MTHRDKAQTAKASNEDEEEPQQERTSSPLDACVEQITLEKGEGLTWLEYVTRAIMAGYVV